MVILRMVCLPPLNARRERPSSEGASLPACAQASHARAANFLARQNAGDRMLRTNTERLCREAGATMDAFSEVLSAVRLKGALFFCGEFSEPWAIAAPPAAALASALALGEPHLVVF